MASIAFPLLQAAQSTTGSLLTTFIPFGLVILIFYFLIIRPQNKKQKETQRAAMQNWDSRLARTRKSENKMVTGNVVTTGDTNR